MMWMDVVDRMGECGCKGKCGESGGKWYEFRLIDGDKKGTGEID
jgi:hypothetical protein